MTGDIREQIGDEAQLFSHRDPRQRVEGIRRVMTLAKQLPLAERAAVVPILEQVVEDREAFVRRNLVVALGEIAHERGVPVLERLSADEHANVRFRVALALSLIGHESAIPTLEKLAADSYRIGEHYVVRAFAALALGRFPQEAVVRILDRLVEDADPAVRWHAAVALGDIGLPRGVEPWRSAYTIQSRLYSRPLIHLRRSDMEAVSLESLVREHAPVRRGHFLLSSGMHTPYYVVLEAIVQNPGLTATISHAIAERFRERQAQAVLAALGPDAIQAIRPPRAAPSPASTSGVRPGMVRLILGSPFVNGLPRWFLAAFFMLLGFRLPLGPESSRQHGGTATSRRSRAAPV